MPKITDPDDLNVGTEITINTTAKTFTLVAAGNLVAKDGVTLNALWAKFVDLWTSPTYQPFPFPMNLIDARSGQGIFGQDPGGTYNGWKPANDTTRQMIRDGGWSEFSNAGALNRQYVGIVGLASGFPAGAQFYYQKVNAGAANNFTFTDAPNEAIQVYGDATNGNFDSRTFFKIFCREYDYTYDDAVLGDVGESGTGAYKVSLPVAVSGDLKVTDTDSNVDTISPYTAIQIRYLAAAYNRDIDLVGTPRNFGIVIDVGTYSQSNGATNGTTLFTSASIGDITVGDFTGGTLTIHEGAAKGTYNISGTPVNNAGTLEVTLTSTPPGGSLTSLSFTMQRATPVAATAEQIYTKIQRQLRATGDINDGGGTAVTGQTADLLMRFVGDTLVCGDSTPTNPLGGGSGVVIEGFDLDDKNRLEFYDNAGTKRVYPYVASGSLNFNSFLTQGGAGYYKMYFTTLPGASNDYGESGAVVVDNASGADISGTISGASISFDFDYDNNVQGGRTAGTDAAVTIIAGNPGYAKPVVATGTISRSKGISLTLTAEQDRGYIA
jgi:hypothetical protein